MDGGRRARPDAGLLDRVCGNRAGHLSIDERAESLELVAAALRGADAKLGEEPVVLDVGELLSGVEFFIVVSGRNTRQVATIVEAIEEQITLENERKPIRIEGLKEPTWVLMDYGDVVIHVFLDETRRYYDLEHLWSSARVLDVAGLLAPESGSASAVRD